MPARKKMVPRPTRRKSVCKPANVETKAVAAPTTADDKPLTIIVILGRTPTAGRLFATIVVKGLQGIGRFGFDDSTKGYQKLNDGLDAIAGWRRSPLLTTAIYKKIRPRLATMAKQRGGVHFHFRILATLADAVDLLAFVKGLPCPKTIAYDEPPGKPRAWDFSMRRIPAPNWVPDCGQIKLDGISQQEFESLQWRRPEILALLNAEVERYVNVNALPGGDSFPDRDRLTGEFYIGSEKYSRQGDPVWFRISIFCRCLEHPRPGSKKPDDYLGLEVYFRCEPGSGAYSVLDTDESSI